MKSKIMSLIEPPVKILIKYKYLFILFILYLGYFLIFQQGEPNCLIKHTIGFPCPGCGMTRAVGYLISFDFENAFFYHPLVFTLPFLIFIFLYQDTKILGKIAHSKIFWISVIILFIIVYIIRMILYFPDTEPMDYYNNPYIIKFLRK